MRQREHQVLTLEHRPAAARHVAAEGLDVLIEVVRPVDPPGERVARVQLMIDFSEKLVRPDVVRDVAGFDFETGSPQNRRRRAVVLTEKGDVVRVVYRDEVVCGNVEPFEGQEIERAITFQRTAERRAVLLLRVRGLVAIDSLPGGTESLEVILRIQRSITKKE